MFITFKLTLKRLFIITAVIILAVLGLDVAKKIVMPRDGVYVTHAERAEYLKKQGIEVESEPADSKQTVIDEKGAAGWAEYGDRLKKQGFDITPYLGRRVTVEYYRVKGDDQKAVRMLICDNRVVAYEVVNWF